MAQGKETCKILKEIRRKIAEANGIEFATSECRYKGDCLGTCPKCEAEVRYLEQQLRARSLTGKAVVLAGISAASLAMFMPMTSETQTMQESPNFFKESVPTMTDSITVRGIVWGGDTLSNGIISKEPLIGATISNKRTALFTSTDSDAHFKLPVCIGDTLEVRYVDYEPQTIIVTEDMRNVEVTLAPSQILLGEPPMVAYVVTDHYLDLNVVDEKGNRIDSDRLDIERIWIDENGQEHSEYIYPFRFDEKHPCRISWEYENGLMDDTGMPLKEATLRITAEAYDTPVVIQVKYPKRNAKRTIKFKHKKK